MWLLGKQSQLWNKTGKKQNYLHVQSGNYTSRTAWHYLRTGQQQGWTQQLSAYLYFVRMCLNKKSTVGACSRTMPTGYKKKVMELDFCHNHESR